MHYFITTILLFLVASASAMDRWPTTGSGGTAINVPQDTDRDGSYDYIFAGDYDGDGVLEMSDLQAAYNTLTDSGGRHLVVAAGSYSATLYPGNTLAMIEVDGDNNTKIECNAGAVLTTYNLSETDASISIFSVSSSSNFPFLAVSLMGEYQCLGAV